MTKRKTNIRRLLRVMAANQITLEDLALEQKELNRFFYVLCRDDQFSHRVPYEMGRAIGNICGIFPFEDSEFYLELEEQLIPRAQAEEEKIPDIDFLERLYLIKDRINAQLEILGAKPLEGCYYAKSCAQEQHHSINWITDFTKGSPSLPFDAYDPSDEAKARYVGIYGKP